MTNISIDLNERAQELIPGGTQLLSKSPVLHHPQSWPSYYSKAKGCYVWDVDGRRYLDMAYMGIGTNLLGYADDTINKAVETIVQAGNVSTLNAPEEVELAEVLCDLHPWADMVRYSKTGGEANAIAIRIARAYTEKEIVLFCGYHGWHDWYLAANLNDDEALEGHLLSGLLSKGVPESLKNTAFPFPYNNKETFAALLKKHEGKIGAVIMEPMRNYPPEESFLEFIREETKRAGIVLIFDEISSGFRSTSGGYHLELGVNPDIAVFGKTLSNGYPMAAVIGNRSVMSIASQCFISSAYWTDRIGLVAALAFVKKCREEKVLDHIQKIGKLMIEGWRKVFSKFGFDVEVTGLPALCSFSIKGEDHALIKTLITQEMLKHDILATNAFYASYTHDEKMLEVYFQKLEEILFVIRERINKGTLSEMLEGEMCKPFFKRLN